MKYVRTKNGIYEYTSHSKAFDGIYTTAMGINHIILYKEIVKQSDTIEELCDTFVAVNIKHNSCRLTDIRREKYYEPRIPMYYAGEHTHDFVDDYIKNEGLIFGAIWTEWGLKYVAKMNEKGELELI